MAIEDATSRRRLPGRATAMTRLNPDQNANSDAEDGIDSPFLRRRITADGL
jgi:hypothetical protein